MKSLALVCAGALCAASSAMGAIVEVNVVGSVDFNGINFGSFAGIPAGAPASMSFLLDSNNYVDSTLFPTRGYVIDQSSFQLTMGTMTVGMPNPFPAETPYFVVRDNDPAVDGFFLASTPDAGFPNGVPINEGAIIDPLFRAIFNTSYEGTRLSSLDILGAVGTYDFSGLGSFNWGLEDAGIQPTGLIFDYWTISVVPAPAGVAIFGLAGMPLLRRRRVG